VQVNHVRQVQKLPFVLVNALDVYVEEENGSTTMPAQAMRRVLFAREPRKKRCAKIRVVGAPLSSSSASVGQPARPISA
jgi:hypothetical protein